MKQEMKMKNISLAILCMFILISLSLGTAVAKNTAQTTIAAGDNLRVVHFTTFSYFHPIGVNARVLNDGSETINGPITVTLTIKKGFFGLRSYDTITYTALEEGQSIKPGDDVILEKWYPNPGVYTGIYTFKYTLNFEDDNPDDNIDSGRYFVINNGYCRLYEL